MDISVYTAQNVNIAYKPAGLANRIGATFIDFALLGDIYLLSYTLLLASLSLRNNTTLAIIILLVLMSYHFICEYFFNGQSLGKLMLHLKVVRLDGRKLSFWDCLLRWVLRLIDITVSMGMFAMLSIIISTKMQRLGDLAAGTTVIQENKKTNLNEINAFDTPEEYEVTFPQIYILTDKDVTIIKEIFQEFEKNKEYRLLEPLADKVKELTGIETNMNNLQFIQTVIQDYMHLTKF